MDHKRTGLTETVLVISISVCTNSTFYYSFYRNSAGRTSRSIWFIRNFLLTVFVLSGLHCKLVSISLTKCKIFVLLTLDQAGTDILFKASETCHHTNGYVIALFAPIANFLKRSILCQSFMKKYDTRPN